MAVLGEMGTTVTGDLSILCVTTGTPRAQPFFEHFREVAAENNAELVILEDGKDIQSKGYIESCLDEAISRTSREYVLRLDDDEQCSLAMRDWLARGLYRERSNWHFPRVHLWHNPWTVLLDEGYFPDVQTRLAVRERAGRPPELHAASRWPGWFAPVCIEHWTFLVKSYAERLELAEQYLRIMNADVSLRGTIEDQKKGQLSTFGDWVGQSVNIVRDATNHVVQWPETQIYVGPLSGSR